MKESPFYARKHVITHTRGINEQEKQNALQEARTRFEKKLMADKFVAMETNKYQKDINDQMDRFDAAKKEHKKEEQANLVDILKEQMNMGKLRKELDQREHREVLSKNFGPEETQERCQLEVALRTAKRDALKSGLEAQMEGNVARVQVHRKNELVGDMQQLATINEKYRCEALESKYRI